MRMGIERKVNFMTQRQEKMALERRARSPRGNVPSKFYGLKKTGRESINSICQSLIFPSPTRKRGVLTFYDSINLKQRQNIDNCQN
jgi:hypothetical protein